MEALLDLHIKTYVFEVYTQVIKNKYVWIFVTSTCLVAFTQTPNVGFKVWSSFSTLETAVKKTISSQHPFTVVAVVLSHHIISNFISWWSLPSLHGILFHFIPSTFHLLMKMWYDWKPYKFRIHFQATAIWWMSFSSRYLREKQLHCLYKENLRPLWLHEEMSEKMFCNFGEWLFKTHYLVDGHHQNYKRPLKDCGLISYWSMCVRV